MYTSFAMLALVGSLVMPAPSPKPDLVWMRDYKLALNEGVKEGKPLAVFVGTGFGHYGDLAQDGALNDTIKRILADSYVCVYLDANSANQATLIQAFAVTKGKGIVLSDRSGRVQAYQHDGSITVAELTNQLQYFANPAAPIQATISNTDQSYYAGTAGTFQQSYYPPVTSARVCST